MRPKLPTWKIIVLGFLIIVAVIINYYALTHAKGEDLDTAYVICMPNDKVNIRFSAKRSSEATGWCEPGDIVYLDGKSKNGFLHCVNLSNEYGEGWIHKGYIVYDQPKYVNQTATIISKSRLAARKYIDGKRTRWLKPGAELKVYYWTESWCMTNCGYVQSKYLELNGE